MMDVLGKPMVDATVTKDGKLWWPITGTCARSHARKQALINARGLLTYITCIPAVVWLRVWLTRRWHAAEALYALVYAYTLTNDEKWLNWLRKVHQYA
jgi:hypothetical protein